MAFPIGRAFRSNLFYPAQATPKKDFHSIPNAKSNYYFVS